MFFIQYIVCGYISLGFVFIRFQSSGVISAATCISILPIILNWHLKTLVFIW